MRQKRWFKVALPALAWALATGCGYEGDDFAGEVEDLASTAQMALGGRVYYLGYGVGDSTKDNEAKRANGAKQVESLRSALSARGSLAGSRMLTQTGMGRSALDSAFAWIQAKAIRANDTAVIYMHTHGSANGMYLPQMTWSTFAEKVMGIPAGNVVVFLNNCHSAYGVEALKNHSTWSNNTTRNFGAYSAVGKSEVSTSNPPWYTVNPLPDVVKSKMRRAQKMSGLSNVPKLTKDSYSYSLGKVRNPVKATSIKASSRYIW